MKKFKKYYVVMLICMFGVILFSGKQSLAAEKEKQIEPPIVTMAMIPEFQEKPSLVHSIQPTALHASEIYNYINPSSKITSKDILKFLHPSASEESLSTMTVTFDESLSYLKNKGINYTKVSKYPNWKIIVSELRANRPVLIHLKANTSYWIEQETSVFIWGIQVFEYPNGVTNILYFTRSLNHADNPIFSGMEESYDLLTNESSHDPSLNVKYSWAETVYGLKK